jgi:ABC-type multidrug transport system ATPase subunit
VNGYPRDVPTFRRVRGHVTHTDVHPVYATVRECVVFSAKLRLPRETTPGMRDALVNEVGLALLLTEHSSNEYV